MRFCWLVILTMGALIVAGCTKSEMSEAFPIRAGQRYRTVQDIEVIAMTHWNTAFTGGHHVTLPAGEVFTVAFDPPEQATAASCDPERYAGLHERFIPAEDRQHPKYSNYSLSIDLQDIREKAELLSE